MNGFVGRRECLVAVVASLCFGMGDAAWAVDGATAFDFEKAKVEVVAKYSKAHPEVQEYIVWTARQFGPGGLWLNEDAFAELSDGERDKKVVYIAALLEDSEYDRHLCGKLAEAGSLKDKRLVPGLMRVAGYHQEGVDYDCRAKWMATAALARQESEEAVPLLITLVDHGNQNTRMWARAALARITGQDFKQDKEAWEAWWKKQRDGE
jgi:hypothetical protein